MRRNDESHKNRSAQNIRPMAFPWQEAMSFGLGYMKLSSHQFWNLTPKELHAAMQFNAPVMSDYPERSYLTDLMALYPDHEGMNHV